MLVAQASITPPQTSAPADQEAQLAHAYPVWRHDHAVPPR
jgi:hypothetical protein